MKISKEKLIDLIKEELEQAFGSDSVSRSARSKELRQKVKASSSEQGVDSKERGIIQRIEANLTKLADLTNLKSGSTFALLKRLNGLMEKEIEKLERESAKDAE